MFFFFTIISAQILLHILAYRLCAERHILPHVFMKCCCHLKHQTLFAQKLLCFSAKMLAKFTSGICKYFFVPGSFTTLLLVSQCGVGLMCTL
jgi:hypothetical protein